MRWHLNACMPQGLRARQWATLAQCTSLLAALLQRERPSLQHPSSPGGITQCCVRSSVGSGAPGHEGMPATVAGCLSTAQCSNLLCGLCCTCCTVHAVIPPGSPSMGCSCAERQQLLCCLQGLAYMHSMHRLHQSLGPGSVILSTHQEIDAPSLQVQLRDLAFAVDIRSVLRGLSDTKRCHLRGTPAL